MRTQYPGRGRVGNIGERRGGLSLVELKTLTVKRRTMRTQYPGRGRVGNIGERRGGLSRVILRRRTGVGGCQG